MKINKDLRTGGGGSGTYALDLTDTVTITGNLTKNYKLPGGFRLSGTVKDLRGLSVSSFSFDPIKGTLLQTTGSLLLRSTTDPNAVYSAAAQADTGNYSVILPAGTYNAVVNSSIMASDATGFTMYSIADTSVTPSTVTVTADKTQNFVRADLPGPGTLTGTVTGTNFEPQSLTFYLGGDGFGSGSSQATFEPPSTSYSMTSGPGNGRFMVSGHYAPGGVVNDQVTVQGILFNQTATVTSGGTTTKNLTIPTLVEVNGTVTAPTGETLTSVGLFGNNLYQTNTDSFISSWSIDPAAQTSPYILAVPAGSYYQVASLTEKTFGAARLNLSYGRSLAVPATNPANFTLPAIPQNFVFDVIVTGPDNKPISNASVFMNTKSTTGTLPTGYYCYASTNTDAAGHFALTVPAGTYYVNISPPTLP
jgi:hypothetical protein